MDAGDSRSVFCSGGADHRSPAWQPGGLADDADRADGRQPWLDNPGKSARAQASERQQIKWLLYAGAWFVVVYSSSFFLALNERLSRVWGGLLLALILPIPVAIAIAILRYRLYDIDIIIRKTLVYAVLSGLLALIYFGMVVLLQSVFNSVSGQQSPIAIVITTRAIAALFAPLRRRIQDVLDRRFYRQKYNAQQVLAQFAQTACDETDMEALQAELLRVVQETMQPEQVSLWLKPTGRENGG